MAIEIYFAPPGVHESYGRGFDRMACCYEVVQLKKAFITDEAPVGYVVRIDSTHDCRLPLRPLATVERGEFRTLDIEHHIFPIQM